MRRRAFGVALVVCSVLAGCGPTVVPPTSSGDPVDAVPLALARGDNGDAALTSGSLLITDTCSFLVTGNERVLLVWPAASTTWDAASQSIVFVTGGQVHQMRAGQRVSFGGSGGSPAQLDGLTWVVPPMPECAAPAYWFVGGVVNGG